MRTKKTFRCACEECIPRFRIPKGQIMEVTQIDEYMDVKLIDKHRTWAREHWTLSSTIMEKIELAKMPTYRKGFGIQTQGKFSL